MVTGDLVEQQKPLDGGDWVTSALYLQGISLVRRNNEWHHFDPFGTAGVITNGSAQVLSNNLYDLFGVVRYQQGSAQTPWRWRLPISEEAMMLWGQEGGYYAKTRVPTRLAMKSAHILLCRRPMDRFGILWHYWIAACGKTLHHGGIHPDGRFVPRQGAVSDEERKAAIDDLKRTECLIIPVSPHEKRCVCKYGLYVMDGAMGDYDWLFNNCQHFVFEVFRGCLLDYNPTWVPGPTPGTRIWDDLKY